MKKMVRARENRHVLKVDGPGYCSLEKDCWWLSFRQPRWQSSSEPKEEVTAKAVETSFTSFLSQDYPNLDHLTSTCVNDVVYSKEASLANILKSDRWSYIPSLLTTKSTLHDQFCISVQFLACHVVRHAKFLKTPVKWLTSLKRSVGYVPSVTA